MATPTDPLSAIPLDDPRIQPLRERIHAARGHHWQPACGACFDEAYRYLRTGDILDHPAATALDPPDRETVRRQLASRDPSIVVTDEAIDEEVRRQEAVMAQNVSRIEALHAASAPAAGEGRWSFEGLTGDGWAIIEREAAARKEPGLDVDDFMAALERYRPRSHSDGGGMGSDPHGAWVGWVDVKQALRAALADRERDGPMSEPRCQPCTALYWDDVARSGGNPADFPEAVHHAEGRHLYAAREGHPEDKASYWKELHATAMSTIDRQARELAAREGQGLDGLLAAVRDWMQFGAGDGTDSAEAESDRLLRRIAAEYAALQPAPSEEPTDDR